MLIEMPSWMTHLLTVCLGLIVGSFLNVIIIRLPRNQSVIRPRSRCPGCEQTIAAWDNIPILSYLILRGKCRKCKIPISVRYPIVEFLTALLFLTTELKFGFIPVLWFRHWPFVSILLAVTFIDLEHRIIPDWLSLGGCLIGLGTSWMEYEPGWRGSIFGFLFGFGVFYFFALLYFKLRNRSGLGGGDVKLLGMIGSFLGIPGVFVTILISSTFGSLVGIAWALTGRKRSIMKFSIPYGPFLVVGALCYYLLGENLWFQFMIPT